MKEGGSHLFSSQVSPEHLPCTMVVSLSFGNRIIQLKLVPQLSLILKLIPSSLSLFQICRCIIHLWHQTPVPE